MIDVPQTPRPNPNRRVIHATCTTHGGEAGFTNLVVSKRDGAIELDPHVTVPDVALLERVLTGLRQWNPEPRRRTPGAPQFGATCRRARPGDPPAD